MVEPLRSALARSAWWNLIAAELIAASAVAVMVEPLRSALARSARAKSISALA